MKSAILGLIAGGLLFAYGVKNSDQNYRVYRMPSQTFSYYADYTESESKAFGLGVLGSAVMTVSAKHLWNQRKPRKSQDSVRKLRESIQILAGLGLMASGFELHDLGSRYDQTVVHGSRSFSPSNHSKERLGFMVGMVGTSLFTSSAINLLGSR